MVEHEETRFGDFLINNEGVFFVDQQGDDEELIPVCSPLMGIAITRNVHGKNWGKLYTLIDPQGTEKRYHMRNAANRSVVISELVHEGLILSPNPRARSLLLRYLGLINTKRSMLSSSKLGWVNSSFVLPDACFGPEEVLYSGGYQDHAFGNKGDWKSNIGKYCPGNSRLVLAASAGFAAPLLAIVEMEGGGIFFQGTSSKGKSTAGDVAASLYGHAQLFVVTWNTTKNALEEVAEAHNDCLLVLDELGEADPRIVGEALYMIANGQGKARMGQTKRRWRTLFITSGEPSLAEHMAAAGKEAKKGQEVRLLNITADAGAGIGMFEQLHGFQSPAKFAEYFYAAARQHYGTPMLKFLTVITKSRSTIEAECRSYMDAFNKLMTPPNVTGEVARAIRRFALVAAAGEIATAHKLTGWKPGESTAAAEKCFLAWMEHRRTFDPVAKNVDRVRRFIVANEKRFEVVGGEPITDKVGYKKKSAYLILPDIFRDELCAGIHPDEVAEHLESAGYLNTSGKNRLKKQERIGGELMYCYSISEKLLEAK